VRIQTTITVHWTIDKRYLYSDERTDWRVENLASDRVSRQRVTGEIFFDQTQYPQYLTGKNSAVL